MPLSGCNNIAASAIQVSSNLTAECSLAGLLVVNQIRNTWSFQHAHTKDRRKTRLVSQAGMTDNPWLFLLLAATFKFAVRHHAHTNIKFTFSNSTGPVLCMDAIRAHPHSTALCDSSNTLHRLIALLLHLLQLCPQLLVFGLERGEGGGSFITNATIFPIGSHT